MSNETPQNDINNDPSIKVTETVDAPAQTNAPSQSTAPESTPKSKMNKATGKLKKLQHGFVELKINRQLHILMAIILMIGLVFGGAIEKIIILLIAVPLFVSGITGIMFLEKALIKMPWNKAQRAAKEVQKEAADL